MKKYIATVAMLIAGGNVLAASSPVEKAAAKMKINDTRTVIKEVENTDDNPCMPEGKSFQVELQVKQAGYDRTKNEVVYKWETVKMIGVDREGHIMEVCAE